MVGDYRHNSIFDFVTCYWIFYCNEFFWLFEFYDGVINFLTEFRNFRPIKFSDNLELSASDLNFRVVSGFGELFEFPTAFHCLSSPIRFWCIFLTVVPIFGRIIF